MALCPRNPFASCAAGVLLITLVAWFPLGMQPAVAQTDDFQQLDEVHQYDHGGCGKARAMMRAIAARQWVEEEPNDPGPTALREAFDDTDVLHYNLDIEIFPATETISGTNTITIESLVDGLTEFTFRLRENFTITSATVNGTTPVTVALISTTTREATLDRAYNAGEVFTLEIAYSGHAESRGFGSIEFDTQGGSYLVSTLSEPYFAYTWWPCKDGDYGEPGDNADKATVELAVTAPDDMRTVSNGLLVGTDTLSGGRTRYRWASNYPIATYLVAFCSTNYNTWTVNYDYGTGTMPVEFNIYPSSDTAGNRAAWEKCVQMLATYKPMYGLYPFVDEKYGIYQFQFGGGMEHQTNTGQGTFAESVTAHELGHQWWGDAITCRTWHDIWLNEGFATYTEALWAERKPGSTGLPALFNAMASRRPSSVGDSVYCYDTSNMNRIFSGNYSYNKGAWVLHQLRHVVGNDVFFQILADYRAAFEGGAATTDDFAAVASSTSGRDLSWFFDEWVYGIGAPAYDYGWQSVEIAGQNYLRLYIEQTQSSSYGTYTMPIDVRVDYASGSETYTVWNDADAEHFVVPISAPATSLTLDEHDWILTTRKSAITYVAGPPAVVQSSTPPGAAVAPAMAPDQLAITFSDDVICSAADFTVEEATTGSVAFTFDYSSTDYTATLDFATPLPTGSYTITISDAIESTGGIALDGELDDPTDGAELPSGDGLAGGDAVFAFGVSCAGDLDGDGDTSLADLQLLLAAYGTTSADPNWNAAADFDNSDTIDLADLQYLLSDYGCGA